MIGEDDIAPDGQIVLKEVEAESDDDRRAELIDKYTCGECWRLACALHVTYGLSMVVSVYYKKNGSLLMNHAWVKTHDERHHIDIYGARTMDALIEPYGEQHVHHGVGMDWLERHFCVDRPTDSEVVEILNETRFMLSSELTSIGLTWKEPHG